MAVHRIMHISDMHFSENEDSKSLLQKESYINDWFESLKGIESLDTLIISGDIVNQGGSETTYGEVKKLIDRLRNELKIKYILCVPGNHDVNRGLLEGIKGKRTIDPNNLWQYYDKKLEYYWDFMKDSGLQFDQNSGLISSIILHKPNVILMGLDSTDQIGLEDTYGFINVDKLEEGLRNLFGEKKKKYGGYIKIVVLHHTPIIYQSRAQVVTDNNSNEIGAWGTCNAENWEKVKKILLDYDTHYVLTGHVHGSQSGQIRTFEWPNDEINYSTVGSIGVDFSKELQKQLDPAKDVDLINRLKGLKCSGSLYGHHNAYNIWTISDTGLVKEEQYKYIIDEGNRRWICWNSKEFKKETSNDSEGPFAEAVVSPYGNSEEIEDYGEKILECVRENKLFKTGHYHWKGSARINWIDTSYFFQHRQMMFFIARGINNLFTKNDDLASVDCIIGLGIKGSMLLSYIRFLFPEKPCSYLPENMYEYNDYEKALFEGDKKLRKIAILTDVVHSGNTVKKVAEEIHERVNNFLDIHVVTIFDSTQDQQIAKIDGEAKFTLHSLAHLKVIDCQGAGNGCEIYTRKLANVIEYNEDQKK